MPWQSAHFSLALFAERTDSSECVYFGSKFRSPTQKAEEGNSKSFVFRSTCLLLNALVDDNDDDCEQRASPQFNLILFIGFNALSSEQHKLISIFQFLSANALEKVLDLAIVHMMCVCLRSQTCSKRCSSDDKG
jgi:hypothetical protein